MTPQLISTEAIYTLHKHGVFSDLDIKFAEFVRRFAASGDDTESLFLATALLSRAVDKSHICLDIGGLVGTTFPDWTREGQVVTVPAGAGRPVYQLPATDLWLSQLQGHRGVVSDSIDGRTPLVLHEDRLYLHRYRRYEQEVAGRLRQLAATEPATVPDSSWLRDALARVFPQQDLPLPPNWQKIAALAAVRSCLTVISGGPGTGKTSAVARLLSLLEEHHQHRQQGAASEASLRVLLAAPTGKAAARLNESIDQAVAAERVTEDGAPNPLYIDMPPEVRAAIHVRAGTIHRMLGTTPKSIRCRHDSTNPLDADVVIIDEASMIPLPLMHRVLEALPEGAPLILLGDMNQLTSVEPGFVLGDICRAAAAAGRTTGFIDACRELAEEPIEPSGAGLEPLPLADACIQLTYSWRFPPDSPVGEISAAVNTAADTAAADAILQRLTELTDTPADSGQAQVTYRQIETPSLRTGSKLPDSDLRDLLLARLEPYLAASTPDEALAAFGKFRILCALNRGAFGVYELNSLAEAILSGEHESDRAAVEAGAGGRLLARVRQTFYEHRPIIVTRNHYGLGLFNGDIGVVMSAASAAAGGAGDEAESEIGLRAYFPGTERDPGLRDFQPELLPPHETAFAMTVHKSQGSQFEEVLLVLPGTPSPVVTKELLYTGITRVSRAVHIWSAESTLRQAIITPTQRDTGLRDELLEK
ncbi:MAG TPA: exodeoxyribonuclease V subunit alpha [Lentisphaeria bacterium]|nr:exodeoxyribonuclease V subunit alpha [Lentisphaeria bacterium]